MCPSARAIRLPPRMSDIALRFDGILLAASLALAASIYLVIAVVAIVTWFVSGRTHFRLRDVARRAALFAVFYVACLLLLAAYMSRASQSVTGPDWLDWLTIPSLGGFMIGCMLLARRRAVSA